MFNSVCIDASSAQITAEYYRRYEQMLSNQR